jgi:hypothetical protein
VLPSRLKKSWKLITGALVGVVAVAVAMASSGTALAIANGTPVAKGTYLFSRRS